MGPQQHQDVLSRNRGKEIYQGHCITRNNDKNTVFFDDVFLIHSSNYRLYVINELALKSTPTSNMTPQETITINNVSFLDNICNNNHFSCSSTSQASAQHRKILLQTSTKLFLVDFLCVSAQILCLSVLLLRPHTNIRIQIKME